MQPDVQSEKKKKIRNSYFTHLAKQNLSNEKEVQTDPGQISLHIIQMLSAQIKQKHLQHIVVKWGILTQLSEYRSAQMMAASNPLS